MTTFSVQRRIQSCLTATALALCGLSLPMESQALPRIYSQELAQADSTTPALRIVAEHRIHEKLREALQGQPDLPVVPQNAPIADPNAWFIPTVQALYRDRNYRPIFVRNGELSPAARILLRHLDRVRRHGIDKSAVIPPLLDELVRSFARPYRSLPSNHPLLPSLRELEAWDESLSFLIARDPFLMGRPSQLHMGARILSAEWLAENQDRLLPELELFTSARHEAAYTLELVLLEALWNYARELKFGNDFYAPNNPALDVAREYLTSRGYGDESDGTTTASPHVANQIREVVRTPDEWRIDEFDSLLAKAEGIRDFDEALEALVPKFGDYAALMREHDRFEAIAEAGGWPLIPMSWANQRGSITDYSLLFERLNAEGFLSPSATADPNSGSLNDPLKEALIQWKSAHQLPSTAELDEATILALNIPVQERIAQIELALRKIRGARYAHDADKEHIRVNIPAFEAALWDANEEVHRWDVMVGKVRGNGINHTPEMSAILTEIELNPYWYPPQRLMRAGSPTRFVPPGPNNPMGKAKFLFPNRDAIYMHDTNRREWFETPFRAYSAGCIRVDGAEALASLLIARDRKKPFDEAAQWVESKLRTGVRERYYLRHPIPVHVEYRTAFIGRDSKLRFGVDLYNLDQAELDAIIARVLSRHPHLKAERPQERHTRNYRLSRRLHDIVDSTNAAQLGQDGG